MENLVHLNLIDISNKTKQKYWCYEGASFKNCWDNGLCFFLLIYVLSFFFWTVLFILPFCSYCDTVTYIISIYNYLILCNFFLHIIIMYTIVKMWCFWEWFLLWHSVLILNEYNFFSIIINLQCTCYDVHAYIRNRPILFILLTVSQNSNLWSRQKHLE